MTEQTAPLPPRGWYPDPERPDHARWWDGEAWQLSVPASTMRQPLQGPPTLGPGFRARSTALLVLLVTSAVVSCGNVALHFWGRTSVADDLDRGITASVSRYDNLSMALTLLDILLVLATVVTWCTWQYALAKPVPPGVLRRSAGMHAGSWFIPIVWYWFPLQNMRDLWQVYRPGHGRAVLGWWWLFWILCTVTSRVANSIGEDEWDSEAFRDYNTAWLVASLVVLGTALLALYVVATLTHAALTREERQA